MQAASTAQCQWVVQEQVLLIGMPALPSCADTPRTALDLAGTPTQVVHLILKVVAFPPGGDAPSSVPMLPCSTSLGFAQSLQTYWSSAPFNSRGV